MEALGHGLLPLGAVRTCQKEGRCQLIGPIHFLSSPVSSSLKSLKYKNNIRMQAVQEEYELKQMKDMAAAKKRWDALYTHHLWRIFLSLKGISWTMPRKVAEALLCWEEAGVHAKDRGRWRIIPGAIWEGKVKVLTPREAGYAIQLSNKMLLDVRPSMERKKAWVKGSTWIPIFDVDTSLELRTLSLKATNFLMGNKLLL
ncbi:hypothetical protein MTR67_052140 [Solanum verrucosum]|uniref:Rhodanese domain-containing protein n=1 Tax=Solanum verrucosum TaxID=315347 RepID=A0AAF0V6F0_SOLVR|nr:hypothetical protein MTR67_052140 [Solanum verrucosum]